MPTPGALRQVAVAAGVAARRLVAELHRVRGFGHAVLVQRGTVSLDRFSVAFGDLRDPVGSRGAPLAAAFASVPHRSRPRVRNDAQEGAQVMLSQQTHDLAYPF